MYNRIIISRTDSIGDVMLTLPIMVWLKNNFSDLELIYLGKGYTKAIVDCFSVVDQFIDWKEIEQLPPAGRVDALRNLEADAIIHVFPVKEIALLAKKAKIPMRVGTSHRSFHLLNCNQRINFTRKKSPLHESQLNFELLRPFGLKEIPTMEEVMEMTAAFSIPKVELPEEIERTLSTAKKTVILHPKSQGSALEWPMDKYIELANKLVERGYTVFFTGTDVEGLLFRDLLPKNEQIIDTTGKLNLVQLIAFIGRVQNLVACSTGPLHIAGFAGIRTIGLFSPRKPIHPGRWSALGKNSISIVKDPNCPVCKKNASCLCIQDIEVEKVLQEIV